MVGTYPYCAACATVIGADPAFGEVHWEGKPIDCVECGDGIESAYGPVDSDE